MHRITPIEDAAFALAVKVLQNMSLSEGDDRLNRLANELQEVRGKYGDSRGKIDSTTNKGDCNA